MSREQLERAAIDRHGPNFDPALASDEALKVLATTPAVGCFWPGCTADESEDMNNRYYAEERRRNAKEIIASVHRGNPQP